MHPNPIFRKESDERNIAFARERGFGAVSINGEDGPLLAHVPFVISPDASFAELHLVRSNPIARALEGASKAVIAINGGDSYISPDWYEVDDQVPTWNYVAVHLRGSLVKLPQEDLHGILDRLSENFESRLLPKPIWKSDKMDQEVYQKMLRQIVPFKFEIEEVHGTWKLNQNKTDDARLLAAEQVKADAVGIETDALSQLMKSVGL